MTEESARAGVRDHYGEIARSATPCCGENASCCGGSAEDVSGKLGYSADEMSAVPDGANLGLGCGNPTALAGIRQGETVVDLGSGAGFDCFLAARRVGPEGHVIGVDMTPDMIDRARANARKAGAANVEFRLGEIEHLPIADSAADLIISNCVINLSPDKPSVFAEAFRVLKPGGRLMVSDIVLDGELPQALLDDPDAYAACISGARQRGEYLGLMKAAGFEQIIVESEAPFTGDLIMQVGDEAVAVPDGVVVSISVSAVRP